jgi:hypothetical protein
MLASLIPSPKQTARIGTPLEPCSRFGATGRWPRRGMLPLLLAAVLPVAGCFGPTLPSMTPVKGSVSVNGKAITSGQVSFFPMTIDEKSKFAPPSGQIDSTGNYELFTEGKPGAPLGKYKVMVTPGMVPMQGAKGPPKGAFNEKYRDEKKTDLVVEVKSTPEAGAYDLQLKP